jgi:two-component system response regulator MprA
MKVLVVEDERRMSELLRQGLSEEGHSVMCAADGSAGLEMLRSQAFDVMILDVMMPKLNGYQLATRMRAGNDSTAVLMLTAKDSVPDIVHGLDVGADDYMTKPFSFSELLLRLQAIKRRAERSSAAVVRVAGLFLDRTSREVSRDGISIALTRTEYSLLDRLLRHPGKVVSRETLIESVWGSIGCVEGNTLDAFMRLLRRKIDGPGQLRLVHTARGSGYSIGTETQS